ncbi:hypothetical protein JXB11_00220 [Candidatus Woesearchaeota archaeon]|nr:hypothetical protein [Candidatus Woesearchaeota archaeon]
MFSRIIAFAAFLLIAPLIVFAYDFSIVHECKNGCLAGTNVTWNVTVDPGHITSELKMITLKDALTDEVLGFYNRTVILYNNMTFPIEGRLPKVKNITSINVTTCFTSALHPRDRMVSDIFIGTELTYCEKKNYSTPIYECLFPHNCAADSTCVNSTCVKLKCSYCQQIVDHTCSDYECCEDEHCGFTETCEWHKCIGVECSEIQFVSNHTCVYLSCGGDEIAKNHECVKLECADNEVAAEHACVALTCGAGEKALNHTCVKLPEEKNITQQAVPSGQGSTESNVYALSLDPYHILEVSVLVIIFILLILLLEPELHKTKIFIKMQKKVTK